MFYLGVLIGIAATCAVIWFLYGPDGALRGGSAVFDPRHDLFDMERSTIDRMLAEEMAARRSSASDDGDGSVVEGTATDITTRP